MYKKLALLKIIEYKNHYFNIGNYETASNFRKYELNLNSKDSMIVVFDGRS